jgi:hypothetical protein
MLGPMTRKPPNAVRVPEAARIINERLGTNYSLTTIRTWCRTGRIRSFQPAGERGRWWVTPAALEEFIASFERSSESVDSGNEEA